MEKLTKQIEELARSGGAIQNQEASTVAQELVLVDEWVCRYGVVQRLSTEQGKNLESYRYLRRNYKYTWHKENKNETISPRK